MVDKSLLALGTLLALAQTPASLAADTQSTAPQQEQAQNTQMMDQKQPAMEKKHHMKKHHMKKHHEAKPAAPTSVNSTAVSGANATNNPAQ